MTEDEFRAFVEESPWQFAKTMANIPHEYSLRKKHSDDERFAEAVQFIRDHGYEQNFYSKTFTYFDVGDKQYWTMGSPLDKTILINRAVRN
jgi:hypothetical protein